MESALAPADAMDIDVVAGEKGCDSLHNQILDLPVDPELVKQGLPEPETKDTLLPEIRDDTHQMELGGTETTGETAASLMSLAGGAVSYLQSGVNGWTQSLTPSSPDSPKQFLPAMMGQASSPTSRDGKHTNLPPLSSIDVLADLATKQESPQQNSWTGSRRTPDSRTAFPQVQANIQIAPSNRPTTAQSPGSLLPPTPNSMGNSEGTPRPQIQHLSAQGRQAFMGLNDAQQPYYHHHQPHYPPISKDAAASQHSVYPAQPANPDSANLFAAYTPHTSLPAALAGRRESGSSEYPYHSDPTGPPTVESIQSSGPDELPAAVPSPRIQQPRQSGSLTGGGFKCEYEGCKAPAFQTQYLLKYIHILIYLFPVLAVADFTSSHANVHSSARPHYCPVKGCARAEGGKGFKRKNEMIRHGLVHDSPGYVCPFCPDREHKYPRPDNLQRYYQPTYANMIAANTGVGTYGFTTWTKTRTTHSSETFFRSGPRAAPEAVAGG